MHVSVDRQSKSNGELAVRDLERQRLARKGQVLIPAHFGCSLINLPCLGSCLSRDHLHMGERIFLERNFPDPGLPGGCYQIRKLKAAGPPIDTSLHSECT